MLPAGCSVWAGGGGGMLAPPGLEDGLQRGVQVRHFLDVLHAQDAVNVGGRRPRPQRVHLREEAIELPLAWPWRFAGAASADGVAAWSAAA
jgi:hypothetical protein